VRGIRIGTLSKLAIGLASLIAAAPAHGALPRTFVGATAFEDPSSEEFELMSEAVGTYRTNLYWPPVEPVGPGERDWSRYDALIGGAAEHRIQVLATVYGSPGWAAAASHHPPDAAHRDDFEAFLRAAVGRYGPGGEFWKAHPELPEVPIRTWQLWNEPNVPIFWLPNPRAAQYQSLLVAAERAIHAVDSGAQVLLGGLFPSSYGRTGIPGPRYLTDLYDGGAAPHFDAVAVHPYAKDPATALRIVEEMREIMDSHGDADKPIWVTEVGWATSGRKSGLTVSEEVQAEYLREVFALAEANRERLRLEGMIWFSFRDQEPAALWPYRTGLFDASGEPKPAWDALKLVAADGTGLSFTSLLAAIEELTARIVERSRRLQGAGAGS
jgi:hypothetical protein